MAEASDLNRIRSDTRALAVRLVTDFTAAGAMIATAESCTGGLIAATITNVAGASGVFDRGFVTYTNEAKMEMLGVESGSLERHGAVSPVVAEEMARGARTRSRASYAVSVTGIAGPGGGSEKKPVGLVYMGLAGADGSARAVELRWNPAFDRDTIRALTVHAALEALLDMLTSAQAEGEA